MQKSKASAKKYIGGKAINSNTQWAFQVDSQKYQHLFL